MVETGGRSDCLRLCRLLAPESEPSPAPPGPPRNQKCQSILSLGLDTTQKHLGKPLAFLPTASDSNLQDRPNLQKPIDTMQNKELFPFSLTFPSFDQDRSCKFGLWTKKIRRIVSNSYLLRPVHLTRTPVLPLVGNFPAPWDLHSLH